MSQTCAAKLRKFARSMVTVLSSVAALWFGNAALEGRTLDFGAASQRHFVRNVAQFKRLSGADYLAGCDFHLNGVITLVDTNRNLLVLQDATGAVALNFRISGKLRVGQSVSLNGTNCSPYFLRFPDYPYRPTGRDIQQQFEAPSNWGEYHLTRMRGWLRPPVAGEYTFWIASDNSSELWLSTDADPSKSKRVAYLPNFNWVEAHDWSRFPSQKSEAISLKAGELYYIEALQEQSTKDENLSVAWQGPGIAQSVIEGSYLIPWNRGPGLNATNGILREYWTNFSMGDLSGMGGARPFASMLTVEEVRVRVNGQGQLPKPDAITLNQVWQPEANYRWVAVEGTVNFAGGDEESGLIELHEGQGAAQVHVLGSSSEALKRFAGAAVRVEGVCEGVYRRAALTPGLIWTAGTNHISIVQAVASNTVAWTEDRLAQSMLVTNPSMKGFFATHGVVTFNDRVADTDCIFIQDGGAAMRVYLQDGRFKDRLKVGQWMDIGGVLQPGKIISAMTPTMVAEVGWHAMPSPIDPFIGPSVESHEGRWSEIQGVVHALNSNGALLMVGKNGPVLLWIGNTPSNYLARYVDAKIRVRGVLTMDVLGGTGLLIPSRNFVDVEESQPAEVAASCLSDVLSLEIDPVRTHRVRVVGEVTWRDALSFFIQDGTGGIRVQSPSPLAQIGKRVEVIAFPDLNGAARSLNDAVVRAAAPTEKVKPRDLDLNKGVSADQSGRLATARGTLLSHKTNEVGQAFEIQQEDRVFVATLAGADGNLPRVLPGSLVRVTGVCDDETASSPLNILLRTPSDVAVLSGPPWWTRRKAAAFGGTLLAVAFGALLWVYLLRRRLERQQAAQLAFSRQVLERVEEERRHIAANLHDSLGQVLLAIKNHALLAMQSGPKEKALQDRLKEISGTTSQAIEEVRHITHGLRPYQLDRLGLTQAIRALVTGVSENGSIVFAVRVGDIDSLFDKDSEIHVYRIVQEAVNNVLKHSEATEATVVIKVRTGVVTLSIRDNGRGCDPVNLSSASRAIGYGLRGMAERVRILGGTMNISAQPGQGMSLSIEVPLKKV